MMHHALDVSAIAALLPSAAPRVHLLVYRAAEHEVKRWLDDSYVVAALTRESARRALERLWRAAQSGGGSAPAEGDLETGGEAASLGELVERAIQDAFFHLSARDDHFLWLVTWELVNRAARRRFRLHGKDAHGPEQEQALAACAEVMDAKDCGRSVLRTYLERHDQAEGGEPRQGPGSSFWKYLNTAIDRALLDQQRKHRRSNEFWRAATPLESPEALRRHRPAVDLEAPADAYRQLAQKERRRDIRKLIERIEQEARGKRASKRKEIILAWLQWLENPDATRPRSMKALAEQLGVSPIHLRGTIHAFRKQLREEYGEDLQLLLSSTTMGGEHHP